MGEPLSLETVSEERRLQRAPELVPNDSAGLGSAEEDHDQDRDRREATRTTNQSSDVYSNKDPLSTFLSTTHSMQEKASIGNHYASAKSTSAPIVIHPEQLFGGSSRLALAGVHTAFKRASFQSPPAVSSMPKKRGRPSKADLEARHAGAIAVQTSQPAWNVAKELSEGQPAERNIAEVNGSSQQLLAEARLIQPRPSTNSQFPPATTPSMLSARLIQPKPPPIFQYTPAVSTSMPRKRGCPSKADVEARQAAAIARGEVLAPAKQSACNAAKEPSWKDTTAGGEDELDGSGQEALTGARMIQPKPFIGFQVSPATSSAKPKRGRPTKADVELRHAEAIAREESVAPVKQPAPQAGREPHKGDAPKVEEAGIPPISEPASELLEFHGSTNAVRSIPLPEPQPPKPQIKALSKVRDHTTDQLCPEGDEYIPRSMMILGRGRSRHLVN